jgi:hypothetical protein
MLILQIEQELTSVLQVWEDENGEDFLVYGERYLDVLDRLSRVEKAPPARNVPIFCILLTTNRESEALQPPLPNHLKQAVPHPELRPADHLQLPALFLQRAVLNRR